MTTQSVASAAGYFKTFPGCMERHSLGFLVQIKISAQGWHLDEATNSFNVLLTWRKQHSSTPISVLQQSFHFSQVLHTDLLFLHGCICLGRFLITFFSLTEIFPKSGTR